MRHHLQSLAPAALLILLVLFGGSVQAHPGHGGLAGFGSGALHPFTGVDHLLAMLGIGLWSALRGNGVSLRLPLWFVAGAALGTALGFAGLFDERIEIVLAASLIPLGVALLANLRGEHVLALCLVAVCGLGRSCADPGKGGCRKPTNVFTERINSNTTFMKFRYHIIILVFWLTVATLGAQSQSTVQVVEKTITQSIHLSEKDRLILVA